jgi:hypothetical protein
MEPTNCLLRAFHEFQAIAPGIFGVEAARAGQFGIVYDRDASRGKCRTQFVEIGNQECRVRLLSRTEIALDTDVKLLVAAPEPTSAPHTQYRRLFNLLHAQNQAVEFLRGRLAPCGRGNLDMVYARNAGLHARQNITG